MQSSAVSVPTGRIDCRLTRALQIEKSKSCMLLDRICWQEKQRLLKLLISAESWIGEIAAVCIIRAQRK